MNSRTSIGGQEAIRIQLSSLPATSMHTIHQKYQTLCQCYAIPRYANPQTDPAAMLAQIHRPSYHPRHKCAHSKGTLICSTFHLATSSTTVRQADCCAGLLKPDIADLASNTICGARLFDLVGWSGQVGLDKTWHSIRP